MKNNSFGRLSWTIFLLLVSSTLMTLQRARGNEHIHESLHADAPPTPEDSAVEDSTPAETLEDRATEATQPAENTGAADDKACELNEASKVFVERINQLETKVESLASQLTTALVDQASKLKETVCPANTNAPAESGNGKSNVEEYFHSCADALGKENLDDAVTQWDTIEKQTLGPTAKGTLLKDILFLAYEKSKGTVVKFVQKLIESSRTFLPSAYDILLDSMKLNHDNIFSLAYTIKAELGLSSNLFTKLPRPVQRIISGETVTLTYVCKTLQTKLEVYVRDDEMTWVREYWPVIASQSDTLNHTQGSFWTFEGMDGGTFKVKNSLYGDYLWIEPHHHNLRTVAESAKIRNGTDFKLSLIDDDTVTIMSKFYKDASIVDGNLARNISFRPLRVEAEQTPIRFTVTLASSKAKQ